VSIKRLLHIFPQGLIYLRRKVSALIVNVLSRGAAPHYRLLGRVYLLVNDPLKAVACFEAALALEPQYEAGSGLLHRAYGLVGHAPSPEGTAYHYSAEETVAGARLLLNGYPRTVSEQSAGEGDLLTLRIDADSYVIPKGVFRQGELDWVYAEVRDPFPNPHSYESVLTPVRRGDHVIDAGACAGFFTRHALRKGAAKVYAFEPHPALAEALCRTFAAEISSGSVVVVPAALTDTVGSGYLQGDLDYICETRLSETGQLQVNKLTLDEFVINYRVERLDYIKMDIEGEELKALTISARTLARFRPRLSIAVYHQPETAASLRQWLARDCAFYEVGFGGRYMFELPHRPFMLYAAADTPEVSPR